MEGEADVHTPTSGNNTGSAVVAVAAVDIDEASLPQRILSPREFQMVMQFLLGFVKKDKQADGLLERLLVRLSLAQTRYETP